MSSDNVSIQMVLVNHGVRGPILIWVSSNASRTNRKLHFRIRIILGTIHTEFPVLEVIGPDVSGTAPEHIPTCEFRGNSSCLDRSPKIRDSVRLISWHSFLVTLSSFSSEKWVMYSSVIPGIIVFCAWLFPEFPCVSLETAAKFRLSFNVAIFLEVGKSSTVVETELSFYSSTESSFQTLVQLSSSEWNFFPNQYQLQMKKIDRNYSNSTKVVIALL